MNLMPWFAVLKRMGRRWDLPLIACVLLFFAGGQVVLMSASPERVDSLWLHQILALTALLAAAQVPFRWWFRLAPPLYLVGVLLLVAVLLFGETAKGATRWLDLGVVRIQPSELMKLAAPLMLAWYFARRRQSLAWWDHAVAFALLAIPAALILKQPDLGTTILVVAAGGFVLFFAGLSWRLIGPLVLALAIGVGALLVQGDRWCQPDVAWPMLHDYQKQRVCTLLDPERDPLGKGFHTIQAAIAIGSGGVWGKGWREGTQSQLSFVPERHTDFIFAVLAEEFGFFGAAALLSAYALLLLRGAWLAARSPSWAGMLMGGAVVGTTFVYAFVNVAMVSGMLPVVGVPLPFISYGGTALVTLATGLGLLLSAAAESAPERGFSAWRGVA